MIANAGVYAPLLGGDERASWTAVIDINLTGVLNTIEVALPSMVERGVGGAIVITSSTGGLTGSGLISLGGLAYTASKHGAVGHMRSYANGLAPHSIRVNSVHPIGVNTPMVVNDVMTDFLRYDPSLAKATANALPVGMVEAVDISNAIVWLVSDDARYVTGVALPVDAGFVNKK